MPPFNPPEALKTLENPSSVTEQIRTWKAQGETIGFVPTMGALHPGHISLIKAAADQCSKVVASVFVNPTQFNDPGDFQKYPRTLEEDARMLENAHCDLLFAPTVDGIYPEVMKGGENMDFGYLETILEGKYRPGHFKGVGQVVKRLFEIVEPDKAFFGLKDYQQFMNIKSLVKQYKLPVELVGMPTIREEDGLAMSSRNKRLSPEARRNATEISRVLFTIRDEFNSRGIDDWKKWAVDSLSALPQCKVDYVEFAHKENLNLLTDSNSPEDLVVLVAAFFGDVRLIDNLELR